jgi:hypothetical protein
MNEEELQQEIKAATLFLGIDVPIMSSRVVGDRIELFLYGGQRITWKAGNQPEPTTAATNTPWPTTATDEQPAQAKPLDLSEYTRAQLLDLATEHKIPYRAKMTKAQLVKAIQEV